MPDVRYPNESDEYRAAREDLLEEEKRLIENVKAVAKKRRALPRGGKLKEDYTFLSANDGSIGEEVRFSELFGNKETLLLYSFMYGDSWDKPCPSCTSLIDGYDRVTDAVSKDASLVVVAKASPKKLNGWAKERGWTNIRLISSEKNSYLTDYKCQNGDSDDGLMPIMQVFSKKGADIHHFWGSELPANHVDMVWVYWNMMDMTPEGRPDRPTPPLDFESKYLQEHYF